jgi:hypothetical protein
MTMVKYNTHITDPHSPIYMYERIDEHVLISGHSYMECDGACGLVQKHSRSKKIISDKEDWEEIMRTANKAHPNCVVKFDQPLHRDWKAYLKQHYVNARDGHGDKKKVRISKSRWRNYGVGEIWDKEGERYKLIRHPGEVWLRYSNDPKEAPQRLDLRRNCAKKDRYQLPVVGTNQLRSLTITPEPISAAPFVLYKDGPLPLTKEKMQDLRKLRLQCPVEKREQYRFQEAGPDDPDDEDELYAGTDNEGDLNDQDDDDDDNDDDEGGSSSS